jgi:hypothetical protein
MKIGIFLKKKLYLPLTWIIERRAKAADINIKDLQTLLDYVEEMEKKLVAVERRGEREEALILNARLEMADWFIYAKTKGK